jgi:uncharacterized protein YbbC (DUF1343 family)
MLTFKKVAQCLDAAESSARMWGGAGGSRGQGLRSLPSALIGSYRRIRSPASRWGSQAANQSVSFNRWVHTADWHEVLMALPCWKCCWLVALSFFLQVNSVVVSQVMTATGRPRLQKNKATDAVNRGLPEAPLHPVLTGIDVLEQDGFKELNGRRIGLVTNQTGVDLNGHSTISVLNSAPGLKLVALFSPEHGIRGEADALVSDQHDLATGLPIYSLYSKGTRAPAKEQLVGIDTLVYDIQDVGTRFYTYIATCGYLLETAARYKLKMVVLDRPDPIGGNEIEGPLPDAERLKDPATSFVCYHALPVRYGLSIGELANLLNTERSIGAELQIIKMQGWRRADFYDETGLTWINPSPNMRSLTEAVLYPGVGLLETTNLSVGRGTDTPFELIGAPWIDARNLADALNKSGAPGVRFVPVRFIPTSSKYAGEECGGVKATVTDRNSFRPVATSIQIACALVALYGGKWKADGHIGLIANRGVVDAIHAGKSEREIESLWQAPLSSFAKVRNKYLLY